MEAVHLLVLGGVKRKKTKNLKSNDFHTSYYYKLQFAEMLKLFDKLPKNFGRYVKC